VQLGYGTLGYIFSPELYEKAQISRRSQEESLRALGREADKLRAEARRQEDRATAWKRMAVTLQLDNNRLRQERPRLPATVIDAQVGSSLGVPLPHIAMLLTSKLLIDDVAKRQRTHSM
jgi:hypothetical protein